MSTSTGHLNSFLEASYIVDDTRKDVFTFNPGGSWSIDSDGRWLGGTHTRYIGEGPGSLGISIPGQSSFCCVAILGLIRFHRGRDEDDFSHWNRSSIARQTLYLLELRR